MTEPTKTTDLVKARAVAEVALFAAVIVALGAVPSLYAFGLAVPITAQTLGVMLAGAVLGPRRGTAAVAVVIVLVVASLPVLSGGRGGIGVITSPTGGFLLGWLPAVLVVGLLARHALRLPVRFRAFGLVGACLVGGVGVDYALGIPWWAVVTHQDLLLTAGQAAAFLPGDLLKAVLAATAAAAVHHQVHLDQMQPAPATADT
ncbi:MAG: biotin transporter BioY [Micrococcales bacterium]|nr:biotin transporter BioY [Micrococcales bacterium]